MPPRGGPDEDRTRLSRSTAAHPHQRISGPDRRAPDAPPTITCARQATAVAAVRAKTGGKPGDRTLHVRHMKPISPPGELLAALAGRRGVEPRWPELETNPIPDRSLYLCDSGRTRTAILRFGLSDPGPLEDGVSWPCVVYGSRTRVAGLRA